MRNVTLSADEHLIEVAREKARQRKTTLNAEFRKWLQQYANTRSEAQRRVQAYRELMQELSVVSSGGRKFSRDDMNERR
ncbi:hypothetical protein [Thiothrix subterranea]|uniref:Uncharacterized protein n=1 Tax=Thiothrix subterranea TaxID=2735563 RepID=A0AA51R328_9GAMM|nr:hypothetical protein [Thiothrix subterranea]MDQ5768032.1 hypothetical protein [Thiothrix subterranea]WML85206.1 hypothetical protein RCG00_12920 [Thiothrix subterranea]